MGDMVKGMFGGKTSAEKRAESAQAAQRSEIAAERARVDKIAAGQERNRTGRRGLLAFVDRNLSETTGGPPSDAKGLQRLLGSAAV